MMRLMRRLRDSFKEHGGDAAFKEWLIDKGRHTQEYVEALPDLLDAEYDYETWSLAIIAELERQLERGEGRS